MLRVRLAAALAALALGGPPARTWSSWKRPAGGEAAGASLKPGDRLVSWRRPADEDGAGGVRDVRRAMGRRGARALGEPAWARHGRLQARRAQGHRAARAWGVAPACARGRRGTDSELAHALAAAADAAAQARHAEALELWKEALAFAERRGDERMRARILALEPPSFRATRRLADGEAALREALAIRERLDPRGPATASVLLLLAAHVRQGRLERDAGEALARRALEIAREGAPRSLVESRALRQLGSFAWDHGDLDAFRARNEEALVLARRLAPDGIDTMQCLSNIAFEASARGRDAEAERLQLEALAIGLKRFPAAPETGQVWNGLGVLAYKRGDLVTADERYEKAYAIWSKALPGTLSVIGVLSNLANDARERGDVALAEARHRTLLAMREAIAPDSNDVGRSCQSSRTSCGSKGRLPEATAFARRAVEIARKNTPEGVLTVSALAELGLADFAAGRLDAAEAHVREGIALATRIAPQGADAADLRTALAEILAAKGRLSEAENTAAERSHASTPRPARSPRRRRSASLRESVGPAGISTGPRHVRRGARFDRDPGGAHGRDGGVRRLLRDPDRGRLPGGDRPSPVPGKQAEALHVLERSRARQFLVSLKARALAPAFGATERLDLAGIRDALPKGTLLLSYAVLRGKDRPLRRQRAGRRARGRRRP